jgi:hypothetical protein
MGDPDLSAGGGRPGVERPRGLVVLPAVGDEPQLAPSPPSFVRRWSVLIAILVIGAVALVLIALLWSHGQSAPNPQALPPA